MYLLRSHPLTSSAPSPPLYESVRILPLWSALGVQNQEGSIILLKLQKSNTWVSLETECEWPGTRREKVVTSSFMERKKCLVHNAYQHYTQGYGMLSE